MYDLEAIDEWRRNCWKSGLTPVQTAGNPEPPKSMGERFRAAKERSGHGFLPRYLKQQRKANGRIYYYCERYRNTERA